MNAYSHRNQHGVYLGKVKDFLKKKGRLATMLKMAYEGRGIPDWVFHDLVEKTEEHACLVHIDHYFAPLPDEPFHFVAMLAPTNLAFSYAKKLRAKPFFVGAESHEPMCEVVVDLNREIASVRRL